MAGSLNKVTLIGHLGQDPDVRKMQSGDEVASFSLATSDSWTDKATGEKKERTQWHKVAIFNPGLVKVVKSYVSKGSKIYVEGALETRKWEKDGQDHYATEVVLRPFNGEIIMLDSKGGSSSSDNASSSANSKPYGGTSAGATTSRKYDDMSDDIPF